MNWKNFVFGLLFVDFIALLIYAVAVVPTSELLAAVSATPAHVQIAVDLVVALAIGIGWMVADARRRGVSATPYVVATLLTGSGGLLLYLTMRRWENGTVPSPEPLAA